MAYNHFYPPRFTKQSVTLINGTMQWGGSQTYDGQEFCVSISDAQKHEINSDIFSLKISVYKHICSTTLHFADKFQQ